VPAQRTPLVVAPPTRRYWLLGILAGVVALAALVAGSAWGQVHAKAIDPRIIGWASAAALAVFGTLATTVVSSCLGRLVTHHSLPSAGGALRVISAGVGYVVVLFGVLAVLDVSVEKLLVGAGLAGVVLGIAATQSLGNVFAGLVIILARPFAVGDHIRIRSGSLGGVFDGWVMEMSLTYTTLSLDDGVWKLPNAALLAAGVGQLPRTTTVPPLPQVPVAPPPGGAPAPPLPPAPGSTTVPPTGGGFGASGAPTVPLSPDVSN
jgi:small-conductance mechanosensitive channel